MNNSKNTEIFERMPVAKAVQTMAVPTVIGQLIVLFYNMADTFFVGQTNNPYMVAGASLILPVFNISLAFANLAGTGGGALLSRLLGRKEEEEAKRVFSFSVYLALLIAACFSLGVLLFLEPLILALGASPEIFTFAKQYTFCVVCLGAVPTVMSNTLSNMLRSAGDSKKAGFGITMGGIINILLDPLFMFVLLPHGYEILGAGIATFLSNCISCGYFIVTIRKLGPNSVLKMERPSVLPRKESVLGILNVGVPSFLATLLYDIDYIVLNRLMSSYGDIALAAMGIVLKVERLPLNIGIGIGHGMIPIVAYNYSAKNYKRMYDTARFSRTAGLICGGISIVLYLIFSPAIMRFFIADAQTVALGSVFLRARTLATPLMFLSFFHVFFFNAVGRGKRSLLLGVSRWAAFNIPMLFLLNALFGMYGLVWAQVTADVLTVTLSFVVYSRFLKEVPAAA